MPNREHPIETIQRLTHSPNVTHTHTLLSITGKNRFLYEPSFPLIVSNPSREVGRWTSTVLKPRAFKFQVSFKVENGFSGVQFVSLLLSSCSPFVFSNR